MSATSLALSNLRAIVILIVLAFHSILAYLGSLPPSRISFDAPPYDWQAFPIIDSQRWFGFDLFCAWQDVSLMSLMFFLSGLFVWPSLAAQGKLHIPVRPLVADRPAADPGDLRADADRALSGLSRRPRRIRASPTTGTIAGAAVLAVRAAMVPVAAADPQRRRGGAAQGLSDAGASSSASSRAGTRTDPLRFILILTAASALAYVPLALIYSPWAWASTARSRSNAAGRCTTWSISSPAPRSAPMGSSAGCWRATARWRGAGRSPSARRSLGLALWMTPTSMIMEGGNDNPGPLWLQLAASLGFVAVLRGGCLALLAVCLRFATNRRRWLDSLSANAYGMYLVHYLFVVWMQYALLNAPLPAIVKAAIVFGGAVALSWALVAALGNIPLGARLVGAEPRALAKTS